MPNFESPIGNKKFSSPALREIDVPDESEYYQDQDNVPMQPVNREQANAIARRRTMLPNMQPMDEQSIREFQNRMQNVDVSERDSGDIEREIKEARQARKTGKERLSEGAKRRIEMLLNMTRNTREVVIAGNTFVFQTLPGKEMRAAIMAASEFDGTVQSPFEIRRQLLARSLCQIAGVDVEQFVGSTSLEARLTLVDELDEPLLNRLYDEYLELVKETRGKYAVKNEADVKEIIDDLKK